MDYLVYGFNYYGSNTDKVLAQAKQAEAEFYQALNEAFLPAYVKQMAAAIAAIGGYNNAPREDIRRLMAQRILECIRAVVLNSYGAPEGLVINANYMVAYHRDRLPEGFNIEKRLRFNGAKRASDFEYFLALEGYADEEGSENFVLPVESHDAPGWEKRLLPGAPQAFSQGGPVVIDNTAKVPFPQGFDHVLQSEINQYFSTKAFKSFAVLNVIYGGARLGVINVESNRQSVFGTSMEKKEEVKSMIKPFCLLMGFLIKP